MANNFTTSVNILRDTEKEFHYIPTPNATQVVGQIVNDFKNGMRSFNIIGTYGTGKSSFLLALEQSINGGKRYFNPNFVENPKVEFIKFIGNYNSITTDFADYFDINSKKNIQDNIFTELQAKYNSLGKKNKLIFIILDEFGKFLEYAAKNNPEDELYFIQKLAEFCNNPKNNIVLITTVHQSFESYAYSLTNSQKQEWTKVKGRFREVTFNEPVEQLLFLAAEYIDSNSKQIDNTKLVEKCLKITTESKAFNVNEDYAKDIANKLYPLDLLSANTLTLALQKYGQNERSLFSFLESTDHTGIAKFNPKKQPFYNLGNVYDYLNYNFYSFLTSRYNPDFAAWTSIRSSIEKVERVFEENINDYIIAIKSIGLLNIFAANGAKITRLFLTNYLKTSCGIENSEGIINELEKKKVILYRNHSSKYILFEGTDLDIQAALIEAGNTLNEVNDVTSLINKHFRFAPVFAKLNSYEKGTPRYFEFIITDHPIINKVPVGEIDGYVNLVFNSKIKQADVEELSLNQEEAILYCYFKNSDEIRNLLFEIEKIEKVIQENTDDKVAKRELENIIDAQIRLLNHYITDSIYTKNKNIQWYFKGLKREINNKKDFNKLLSQISNEIYTATPIFKNELVNKHKISTSIHTAKKNYYKALALNWSVEDLGFKSDAFPPEKTIYLTLLKENGISPIRDKSSILALKRNSSFADLWNASNEFLTSTKGDQKKISELHNILSKKPFKLKQGFIDFWVPSFLFLKRDDFALFNSDGYIPNLSYENLELLSKYPDKYFLKSFDIDGVKLDIFNSYRKFLSQNSKEEFNNESFIETIKPFIVFYKGLPDYTKNTKRLSDKALKIRSAIVNSKDPEDTFFDAFPNALGTSINILQNDKQKLQKYTTSLQSSIKELRTAFDNLVKRFEDFICDEFIGKNVEFESYKETLQERFKKLKKHLLLSNQKTFILRIDSKLEDKKAWLSSIAQSVVGKNLESFTDEDEILLYEKFKSLIFELDSLTNISNIDVDDNSEEIIGVKIDSFFSSINPKLVRIPKSKSLEVETLKSALKKKLSNDKTANIAAVLNLLKELLQ